MLLSCSKKIVIVLLPALWLSSCAVFTSLSNASDSVSGALGGASTSLESISTSVQSISGSLASSSGSSVDDEEEESEEKEAFRRDVRNYTAAFVVTGGSQTQFERELGRIARLHGLVNWRTQSAGLTFQAIGAGLQTAGLERETVALRFTGISAAARDNILTGFDRENTL